MPVQLHQDVNNNQKHRNIYQPVTAMQVMTLRWTLPQLPRGLLDPSVTKQEILMIRFLLGLQWLGHQLAQRWC